MSGEEREFGKRRFAICDLRIEGSVVMVLSMLSTALDYISSFLGGLAFGRIAPHTHDISNSLPDCIKLNALFGPPRMTSAS